MYDSVLATVVMIICYDWTRYRVLSRLRNPLYLNVPVRVIWTLALMLRVSGDWGV